MKLNIKNPNDLPTVSIKELIPTQGELKDLTEANYNKLKLSLEKHGFIFPISIWQNGDKNYLIDGHQRQRVIVKEYGDVEVPIIKIPAKDITEAAEILLKVTSQYGTITQQGLDTYIATYELPEVEVYEATHYDAISYLQQEPEVEEDEAPEVDDKEPPKSKLGEVYQLGRHRVMCGDSTDKASVELLMDGAKADMVFTDPPYGVDYEGGLSNSKKREKLIGDTGDITELFEKSLTNAFSLTIDKAAFYVFFSFDNKNVSRVLASVKDAGLKIKALLIWHKINAGFGSLNHRYKQKHEPFLYLCKEKFAENFYGATNEVTVWDIKRDGRNEYHLTQKPIELVARAIKNSSEKSNIVLDLFLGSGSTLIACEQTDRTCYGMELDEKYLDVIRKRWAKYVYPDRWEKEWEILTPAIEKL